ncbi:MAG: septal ring lytic transglycosylase RlpA family protein [Candidatus Dormibacteraeota bacterium]|nr:septal ring lytic transglycosylase RlpA family protein [Candidatus Dormibacteraeota bacterium]
MGRWVNLYAVTALLATGLALPGAASAGSGGSGLNPTGGMGSTPSSGVASGNVPVTATSNGVTLTSNASALLRNGLSFSGNAPASAAGQTIAIERLGAQTHWRWSPTVSAPVAGDGSFSVAWSASHIGRFLIRAVIVSGPNTSITAASASPASASAPTVTTTVYRQAIATQYGPGFYGQRTACGRRLTKSTIGVANRTLKCGSRVAILYRGRTMVVPVIDRGPYANHADWDLTEATGQALGISGTATIGAVSLPRQPPRP